MTQTPTPRTDAEEGAIFAAFSEDRISAKQAIRAMAAESRRHEREAACRPSPPVPREVEEALGTVDMTIEGGDQVMPVEYAETLAAYIRSLSSPAPVEGCPDWTCSDCGHSGSDFRTITYSSPDGTDYDLECPSCGSLEVEESIDQAIHRMAGKLEDARSRLERIEEGESK